MPANVAPGFYLLTRLENHKDHRTGKSKVVNLHLLTPDEQIITLPVTAQLPERLTVGRIVALDVPDGRGQDVRNLRDEEYTNDVEQRFNKVRKNFDGSISVSDKGFGFVGQGDDRIFVFEGAVRNKDLRSGDYVKGVGIRSYDNKKGVWNWIAANIDKA